jgi:RNA polymerase sigma-70 factor (ECF subfamily)
MQSCPEQELLRLARRLDRAALTELYDRHNNGIYYYSLRLLGDPASAEDCAADTFARLLSALSDGRGPTDNIRAYLYRTAHNWIVDYYRRTPTLPLDADAELVQPDDDLCDLAEKEMMRSSVRRAMRLLTPEQQQVVALRFIEGWELNEIALCLRKPVGAVKALQHRAVMALRRLLPEDERSKT